MWLRPRDEELGGLMHHSLLGWIVIGVVAGWLSGKVTRGSGFGLLGDLFLGLVGGVIGGWIFSRLGISAYGFVESLAAATVGAVLLVTAARLLTGGGR